MTVDVPGTADIAVAEIEHPWWGDNPYFLFVVRENSQNVKIDLDVRCEDGRVTG